MLNRANCELRYVKVRVKTVSATEFRARCLEILSDLEPQGIVLTRRGRLVAKVMAIRCADNTDLIGCMKGKVKIKGNIFSTGRNWDAQSRKC
jgi:antitoxin (DNA-binding transcriptional repressor) of toxin-antitoxin stability system